MSDGGSVCSDHVDAQGKDLSAMTDITYDADADAVYIAVGRGRVERTRKNGRFVFDFDADAVAGKRTSLHLYRNSK